MEAGAMLRPAMRTPSGVALPLNHQLAQGPQQSSLLRERETDVMADIMNRWVAILSVITLTICSNTAAEKFKNIAVEEFDKLRKQTNTAVVLDVRTAREFAAGHIAGATNIDWNAGEFEKKVARLDRNKTYLVHCAAGGRSAKAAEKLMTLQFTNVYNLEGGMKAWEKAGKPVEK
jgi:rhodanese-related sulfurtransferase